MGFMFMVPPITPQGNRGRAGGLVVDLQTDTSVTKSYFGHEKVFPHYPFPSESIVAWWSNILPPVTSSFDDFISWESYYSSTGNTYYLTSSGGLMVYEIDGSTPFTSKAVRNIGNYAFTDLNNIFTTSSTATIVIIGLPGIYSPGQNMRDSWIGMTGDNNYYMGVIGNPNRYIIKRDEDVTPVVWSGNPAVGSTIMSFTYEGSTGEYSYVKNANPALTASIAGATNRLGSTQQFRIGGWDGVGAGQLYKWYDCIILKDYKPTINELQSWEVITNKTYWTAYP